MRQGAANFASKNKLVVGATRSQAMTMNPMSKPVRPGTEFLLDDSSKNHFTCKFGFISMELRLINKQFLVFLANRVV